ncbi:MAG TPA: hypothetical protein PLL10_08155, partial [Elusimicrobiales bacterium]|nr:hypothetical protein [Elusimicrobiales bacterium]
MLFECPECHRQISTTAQSCPQCGWKNNSVEPPLTDEQKSHVRTGGVGFLVAATALFGLAVMKSSLILLALSCAALFYG